VRRRSISTSFLVECTILRVLALIDAMTDDYPEWESKKRHRRRIREDEAFDDHLRAQPGGTSAASTRKTREDYSGLG